MKYDNMNSVLGTEGNWHGGGNGLGRLNHGILPGGGEERGEGTVRRCSTPGPGLEAGAVRAGWIWKGR